MRGGQREVLVSLFEKKLIEGPNDLGARVLGLFRDLDDPDRLLRGFANVTVLPTALAGFCGGPVRDAEPVMSL